MLLLPLVLNNTSHEQRKKSTRAIGSIIIGVCLLQFYSAVFDDASSTVMVWVTPSIMIIMCLTIDSC